MLGLLRTTNIVEELAAAYTETSPENSNARGATEQFRSVVQLLTVVQAPDSGDKVSESDEVTSVLRNVTKESGGRIQNDTSTNGTVGVAVDQHGSTIESCCENERVTPTASCCLPKDATTQEVVARSMDVGAILRKSLFCDADRLDTQEIENLKIHPVVMVHKAETLTQHSTDSCGYYALYNAIHAARLASMSSINEINPRFLESFSAFQHRARFVSWFCSVRRSLMKSVGNEDEATAANTPVEDLVGLPGTTVRLAGIKAYSDPDEILELSEAEQILNSHSSAEEVRDDISIFVSGLDKDVAELTSAQVRRLHIVMAGLVSGRRAAHTFVFGSSGHWLSFIIYPTSMKHADRFEIMFFDSNEMWTLHPDLAPYGHADRQLLQARAAGCRKVAQLMGDCLRSQLSNTGGGVAATVLDLQCKDLLVWLGKNAYKTPLSIEDLELGNGNDVTEERLSVKDLKQKLVAFGIDPSVFVERDELVAAVKSLELEKIKPRVQITEIAEGGTLNLAEGTIQSISKANYGFQDDNTDITSLIQIFVTSGGGIHGLRATSEELGTRGNRRPPSAQNSTLSRRLHVEYVPLNLPPKSASLTTEQGNQVISRLENLGKSQNIRLFLDKFVEVCNGCENEANPIKVETIIPTLNPRRIEQIKQVVIPILKRAAQYDEQAVLSSMGQFSPPSSNGKGQPFDMSSESPFPITRSLGGRLWVQKLYEELISLLKLTGADFDLKEQGVERQWGPLLPADRKNIDMILGSIPGSEGVISVEEMSQILRAFSPSDKLENIHDAELDFVGAVSRGLVSRPRCTHHKIMLRRGKRSGRVCNVCGCMYASTQYVCQHDNGKSHSFRCCAACFDRGTPVTVAIVHDLQRQSEQLRLVQEALEKSKEESESKHFASSAALDKHADQMCTKDKEQGNHAQRWWSEVGQFLFSRAKPKGSKCNLEKPAIRSNQQEVDNTNDVRKVISPVDLWWEQVGQFLGSRAMMSKVGRNCDTAQQGSIRLAEQDAAVDQSVKPKNAERKIEHSEIDMSVANLPVPIDQGASASREQTSTMHLNHNQKELVECFKNIMSCTEPFALFYLQNQKFELNAAMNSFLEDQTMS